MALTSSSATVLDFSAVEQLVAEVVACAQAVLKLLVYMANDRLLVGVAFLAAARRVGV